MRIASRRQRIASTLGGKAGYFKRMNATFVKFFDNLPAGEVSPSLLNADFSKGSKTATFTATRTGAGVSPGTYVDSSGVIQTVSGTDNVARIQGGYYDATGFHAQKGLMIEGAMTNRALYSGTPENAAWTKTNITADNDDSGSTSPDGTATANSLTASTDNGTFVQAYAITGDAKTYTASCWLKRKTGTDPIYLGAVEDGTGKSEVTIYTDKWVRVSDTATTDGDDAGKDPAFYLEISNDTDAVYIYGMQLENSSYMTSYVPVAADTALARGAETLKYANSGNRTAATESVFVKFAPESEFANDSIIRLLFSSETKIRSLQKSAAGNVVWYPNQSDSSGCNPAYAPSGYVNVSNIVCAIAYGETEATNARIYENGTAKDSNTTNYTAPAWGTYFYVGGSASFPGTLALNGIVQSLAFFSDAKSAANVLAITNILNS